jgi:hypothetical protein
LPSEKIYGRFVSTKTVNGTPLFYRLSNNKFNGIYVLHNQSGKFALLGFNYASEKNCSSVINNRDLYLIAMAFDIWNVNLKKNQKS